MPDLSRHMMALSPLVPAWCINLLVAACAALALWGLARRVRGSVWRLLADWAWPCGVQPQRITETWHPCLKQHLWWWTSRPR